MDGFSFQMIASEFPVNKSKGHTFSENSRINMKLTKTSTKENSFSPQTLGP
jgi:hypothetical protein